MTSTTAPAAVRLPSGWVPAGDVEGYAAASPRHRSPGTPVLLHRREPRDRDATLDDTAQAVAAGLAATYDDLLVLDVEPVACRRGATGVRLLTTWRDGTRGVTAEHWLVEAGDSLHVLAAVMETSRYAANRAAVRTALETFRHDRSPVFGFPPDNEVPANPSPDAVAEGGAVVLDVDVLAGARRGRGGVVVRDGRAVVALPGLDGLRAVPSSLLPGWLGALVDLAPRPHVDCPGLLVTDRESLDAFLDGPAADAASAIRDALGPGPSARWVAALAGMSGHVVNRWALTRRVLDADGADLARTVVEVVDAGDAGLWRLAECDASWLAGELDGEPAPPWPVAISATTTTDLWELLVSAVDMNKPERAANG